MRDPNRITKICKELEEVWLKCPDLRLGQLIVNVFGIRDIYDIEDEEFIYLIVDMLNRR